MIIKFDDVWDVMCYFLANRLAWSAAPPWARSPRPRRAAVARCSAPTPCLRWPDRPRWRSRCRRGCRRRRKRRPGACWGTGTTRSSLRSTECPSATWTPSTATSATTWVTFNCQVVLLKVVACFFSRNSLFVEYRLPLCLGDFFRPTWLNPNPCVELDQPSLIARLF